MARTKRKASDYDWDRIEDLQKGRESGKGKDAKGGNFRVSSKLRYDDNFSKISAVCKHCGADKILGEKCDECNRR